MEKYTALFAAAAAAAAVELFAAEDRHLRCDNLLKSLPGYLHLECSAVPEYRFLLLHDYYCCCYCYYYDYHYCNYYYRYYDYHFYDSCYSYLFAAV